MDILMQPQAWIALLTLTFLEIVLGIDNIVFISIISGKLAPNDRAKARNIGLALAMIFRIVLLFCIQSILSLQAPLFYLKKWGITIAPTGQSLIIVGGGIFLLYKAIGEIHRKLEENKQVVSRREKMNLNTAIIQIALLNLVFSFDSILTAIGLVSLNNPPVGFGQFGGMLIMILSVIASIAIMMAFSGTVSAFVNRHPTIQILGLSFLILIGVMLLAEGSHLAHLTFGESEIHSIPKAYLYFSIFFSMTVEFINIRVRKKKKIKLN